ncbi:MAG TPA: TetR/AcrR family transcriptional regulator [Pyrinomonadaceae bacterium]|nr:TetR/AcrR family transcriptional regulator [Pyrinomonadaceae bacterium]HMP64520.1 TetR/AcrR family transcriptional regulator [Pyrinomonadaceae bacterium]
MSSLALDTRKKILEATVRLLLEGNGEGVRMEDIAGAAGISRQAVYLHFPSRGELMIASVRYLDSVYGLDEEVKRLREAQTGVEILGAFIEFWGNYVPKIYGAAKALSKLRDKDEAAAAAWKDRMDSVRSGCRRTIETIEHDGLLSPEWTVDEAVDLMWTMLSIENWERLTFDCSWTSVEYVSRMKCVLGQMLLRAG